MKVLTQKEKIDAIYNGMLKLVGKKNMEVEKAMKDKDYDTIEAISKIAGLQNNSLKLFEIEITDTDEYSWEKYYVLSTSEETYDKVMGINAKGTWNVTKTFFRKMKSQRQFKPIRAKIINIASCAGTANGINPMLGIYSASKATVIAFTKLWALELGPVDITVNALSPGVFLTPIYDNDPKKIRQFLETRGVKIPIDKIGDSKWVADLALFLASPTADYITGQNIILDGGMTVSINKL